MGSLQQLLEFFLISLAFGVGLFSIIANSKDTGHGFLKLINSIGFVPLLFAVAISVAYRGLNDLRTILYIIAGLAHLLSYFFHRDTKSLTMWFLYLTQTAVLLYAFYLLAPANIRNLFFIISSALYLGIVTYSMVLGHWYLVAFGLSEKILGRAVNIISLILILKLGSTLVLIYDQKDFFLEGSQLGAGYMFNWIMLMMRVGWGYLILGIMNYFTWRLVKMRSIQSATGILYAMTFFVLVGELISSYLYFNYGLLL